MERILIVIILLSGLLFTNCKKERNKTEPDNPYGLPNATQTGANIFACRVNGVNWISGKGIYNLGGGVSNDTLNCWGSLKDVDYLDILEIIIPGGAAQGRQYNLGLGGNGTIKNDLNKTCNGSLGSNIQHLQSVSGEILIEKIDKINKIISGTFHCKIPVPTCDTINITDGRFDIRYY